jgi:DNA-binding transcriptional ArsR family regulator
MDALDLIVLGRRLTRIGEDAMRGHGDPLPPTGQSLVLRAVFANPDSSITDIAARTGLPQSYVSESVARLREQGVLETRPDPTDRRRTLARVGGGHSRAVARRGAVSVDGTLDATFEDPEAPKILEELGRRLRPSESGPIVGQLDRAREEG